MSRALHLRSRPSVAAFWPVFDAGLVPLLRRACAAAAAPLALLALGVVLLDPADIRIRTAAVLLAAASLLALRARAAAASVARDAHARTVAQATATVEALVAGNCSVPFAETDDQQRAALASALSRLTRLQRDNTETARLLATGAFRRAARPVPAHDPMGVALARITRSMEEIAFSAQRVTRGDLDLVSSPRSEDDALGQAHSAMMRRVATTVRDAEACVRRLTQEVGDLQGEAAALALAVDTDSDRLRHALSRVASVAIQARADADRGAALNEQVVDSELLLEGGSTALEQAAEGLRDVIARADAVQRLARHAGLLAVHSSADASQGAADIRGALPLESEARALAHEAASVASALTRMMVDGTEQVHASGVALDQVALALRKGTAMTREIGVTVRRHATELLQADERLVELHAGMVRHASDARRMSARLELLASHVRQQEAVLRRLDRGRTRLSTPVPAPAPAPRAPTRPELYKTPPHAHLALPRLALA